MPLLYCPHPGQDFGAVAGKTTLLETFLSRRDHPHTALERASPSSSLDGPGANPPFWALPTLKEGCCLLKSLDAHAEPLQVSPGGLQAPQKGLRGLGILAHILDVQDTAPFGQPEFRL